MFHGEVVWRGIVYASLMALGKVITGLWLAKISLKPIFSLIRELLSAPFCLKGSAEQATNDESTNMQGIETSQGDPNLTQASSPTSSPPPKPKSLYPASILALSMVVRGEVGYLIASLGETSGIFSRGSSGGNSEIYLIVIWAITICTLIGPICVGTLVRRVKRLQSQRESSGTPDPLGAWGI